MRNQDREVRVTVQTDARRNSVDVCFMVLYVKFPRNFRVIDCKTVKPDVLFSNPSSLD